jgi:hypothetical protein
MANVVLHSPARAFIYSTINVLIADYDLASYSSHPVWPPRRYRWAMISQFPFIFLPLLAAVVLIPSFMIRVIAAPTCGLVSQQASPDISPSASGNGALIATGWYACWDQLPPSQISWDKYTALTFAFA